MKRKMNMLLSFFLVFFAVGCASQAEREVHEPLPHSHYYPFTEVIGDYHLRLIVDHADGDMALVFEDFAERPVKPVEFDNIEGKVTFPDGRVQEETFRARTNPGEKYRRRYYSRKYGSMPRQRGIFTARGEWIKSTPKFTLEVAVPFKAKDYQLTFQYETPGGKVPYHRR